MSGGTRGSTEGIIKKLEARVADGEFYEAQQMYKTVYHRRMASKKVQPALEIVKAGAICMLRHEQVECGVELGIIYGDTLRSSAIPVSEVSVKAAAEIIEAFPPSTESQQIRVLNRFVRWSRELFGGSRGHPVFHDFCCKCCVELKDAKRAQLHGVRGNDYRGFAGFLVSWAKQGNADEADLFITRAALMMIAVKNLHPVVDLVETYAAAQSDPAAFHKLPLFHFIQLMLRAVGTAHAELFDKTREAYQPSIRRDPDFESYLDTIAHIYFNRAPAQAGIFDMLMKSMFEGEESQ